MDVSGVGSFFGRHEFLIRRLHSLTGLVPVGGYLAFHLATNASILDGPETFQARVDQINALGPTSLTILEWTFIFIPLLFHSLIGMLIVLRGKRNIVNYPYEGNIRYTLQRVTGVIAFVFIFWHVFQMHGWFRNDWWHETVIRPLGGGTFDPSAASMTTAAAIQSSSLMIAFYALGVLASVFHFANGLWSMGITWGVWTSPKAQRWVKLPAAAVGVLLLVVGFGALVGFIRYPVAAYAPSQPAEHRLKAPGTLETPEAETVMFRGGHDRVESKEHEGPVQK
ncbi:MAG: succinate dehydrogenase cytochrome b558 subunit [Thermoguttaceae bacterium]